MFMSRSESGRSGLFSEMSEQPAAHSTIARHARKRATVILKLSPINACDVQDEACGGLATLRLATLRFPPMPPALPPIAPQFSRWARNWAR